MAVSLFSYPLTYIFIYLPIQLFIFLIYLSPLLFISLSYSKSIYLYFILLLNTHV